MSMGYETKIIHIQTLKLLRFLPLPIGLSPRDVIYLSLYADYNGEILGASGVGRTRIIGFEDRGPIHWTTETKQDTGFFSKIKF